jgi:hypothetical protein
MGRRGQRRREGTEVAEVLVRRRGQRRPEGTEEAEVLVRQRGQQRRARTRSDSGAWHLRTEARGHGPFGAAAARARRGAVGRRAARARRSGDGRAR